jgi:hypothetical protein
VSSWGAGFADKHGNSIVLRITLQSTICYSDRTSSRWLTRLGDLPGQFILLEQPGELARWCGGMKVKPIMKTATTQISQEWLRLFYLKRF